MSDFNQFIDPKTVKPLSYHQEERCLATMDGTVSYPVINGIPRFVPTEFYEPKSHAATGEFQTGQSFGQKWGEPRSHALGNGDFDRRSLEEQFLSMLGCRSRKELESLFRSANKTLNAGCGVAWSEYLFDLNPAAQRHCVDISLSVETARLKTAHMPNVTVSQASIFELPYPDEMFDIVYSCGVIHHTPDPKGALLEIGKKVAKKGVLGIYIYNKKPFIRELCDREIRKFTTEMSYEVCMSFSRKMTMLGKALNRITQELVVEKDIDVLGIKAGTYNLQRFLYDHVIKCWYNRGQDEEYADLVNQDWYHPRYASHHTKEEVIGWFTESGFGAIKCIQPPGWEHSGFFISGRRCG
jgi:ubiquinone/menaquinone biosynthesis C-methylase UbiE/uncharacterized protein YbaR (Trm112 family)